MRIVDEIAHAVGWLDDEDRMRRASHALETDGRVWLFDVIDWPGLDDRVRELGEPAGVVQLLDRHNRDCAAVAERLGVPHHVVPPRAAGNAVRAAAGRAAPLLARGGALVARAAAPARRGRARDDPLLPRGRGAGRPPPDPPALAAPLAPGPRARAPARRARRGSPPSSDGARKRAENGAAADPALARGAPPRPPRLRLAGGAGEQARADEPRRRLQAGLADRRVQRLGERRGARRTRPAARPARRRRASSAGVACGRSHGSAAPSSRAASPARARSRRRARSTRSSASRRGR